MRAVLFALLSLLAGAGVRAQDEPDPEIPRRESPPDPRLTPLPASEASELLSRFNRKLRGELALYTTLPEMLVEYESVTLARPPGDPHQSGIPDSQRHDRKTRVAFHRRPDQGDGAQASPEDTDVPPLCFVHHLTDFSHDWRGVLDTGRSMVLETWLANEAQVARVGYDDAAYRHALAEVGLLFPTFSGKYPLTTTGTSFRVEGKLPVDGREVVQIRIDPDPAPVHTGYTLLWVTPDAALDILRIDILGAGGRPFQRHTFSRYSSVGGGLRLPLLSTIEIVSTTWRNESYLAYQETRTIAKVSLGNPPLPDNFFVLTIPDGVPVRVDTAEGEPPEDPNATRARAQPLAKGFWIGDDPGPIESWHGRVVLLEFLDRNASDWVDKLDQTLSSLEAAREAGVMVIGVHAPDDDVEAVQRFLALYHLEFPVLLDVPDPSRPGQGATFAIYDVYTVPDRFLIDREGFLLAGEGDLTPEVIRQAGKR